MTEFRRVLRARRISCSCHRRTGKTYSDETGVENEFHVRELYRDQLQALLDRYFPRLTGCSARS